MGIGKRGSEMERRRDGKSGTHKTKIVLLLGVIFVANAKSALGPDRAIALRRMYHDMVMRPLLEDETGPSTSSSLGASKATTASILSSSSSSSSSSSPPPPTI